MKYYKFGSIIGYQPKVPSFATEITEAEYNELMAAFEERQKAITDYTEKVKAEEITLEEVPTEYYQEVYDIINAPEPEEPISERQALIDEIIADVNS